MVCYSCMVIRAFLAALGYSGPYGGVIANIGKMLEGEGSFQDRHIAMVQSGTPPSLRVDHSKPKKQARKPSKYNKAYGKNFAQMKKDHPRTAFSTLVKRAHRKTKKELA